MNPFNRFQKLFISLFAVIAIILAGGHFCSAFASAHHSENNTAPTTVSYSTDISYKQCCMNKNNNQITTVVQDVQKLNLNTQFLTSTYLASPITIAPFNRSKLNYSQTAAKLEPGGGLVLLC